MSATNAIHLAATACRCISLLPPPTPTPTPAAAEQQQLMRQEAVALLDRVAEHMAGLTESGTFRCVCGVWQADWLAGGQ